MGRTALRIALFACSLLLGCQADTHGSSNASAIAADAGEAPRARDAAMATAALDAAAPSCEGFGCNAPASCEIRDEKPRCVCPSGYVDREGDGSQCDDRDECARAEDNDCSKNAHCENQPGTYKCICNAPAYAGDGKACTCADHFEERDGTCLAPDGERCEDNLDCVHGHCVGGTCCAQACGTPDAECRSADAATCEDGHSCKFGMARDGTACDDGDACTLAGTCQGGNCQRGKEPTSCDDGNPCTDDSCDHILGCKNQNNTAACDDGNTCTTNDHCAAGSCTGTARDCSAQRDACNEGVCDAADGSCKKRPLADGGKCDDGSSCTLEDRCRSGSCTGQGNACGPNASACTPGTPNGCTCATGYHAAAGLCVPDSDECAASPGPCAANAICFDPSNAANDVTCKCKDGYQGDGKTACTPLDPCAGNPCGDGRGSCAAAAGGTHTCACNPGFIAVLGQCVCDLNGTFAVRTRFDISWPNADSIEAGADSTYEWSIERHHYDAQGNLDAELINCGDSNLDLCGQGLGALVPVEAYSQYVPASVINRLNGTPVVVTFSVPAPLPQSKFVVPVAANLDGISLTDPMGAWPSSRKNVQGSDNYNGSATNGARWLDSDGDALSGSTSYTVGPGGAAADGSPSAPVFAYGTHSQVCPRGNPSAPRSAYNYVPAAEGLTVRRIKRVLSATRVISGLDGTFQSCDAIKGVINGPDNGAPHFDTRIAGCVRANGSDEIACSSTLVDFLDQGATYQNKVESTEFSMKRVADGVTCEQVRAASF